MRHSRGQRSTITLTLSYPNPNLQYLFGFQSGGGGGGSLLLLASHRLHQLPSHLVHLIEQLEILVETAHFLQLRYFKVTWLRLKVLRYSTVPPYSTSSGACVCVAADTVVTGSTTSGTSSMGSTGSLSKQ